MFFIQVSIGFQVLERQVTLILIALSTEGFHMHFPRFSVGVLCFYRREPEQILMHFRWLSS